MYNLIMLLFFVLRLLFVFREVSGTIYAPPRSLNIWDVAHQNSVVGVVPIEITNYNGPVERVTFNGTDSFHEKNFDIEIVYKADKMEVKVTPTKFMLDTHDYLTTKVIINLNDASHADIDFTFYKIDIISSPAPNELVYDGGMDKEEKNTTAFSCNFNDKPGLGSLESRKIVHLESKAEIATSEKTNVTTKFDKLVQMVETKEEEKARKEKGEEEKKEVYACQYRFKWGGETVDFSREFTVTFKPDDKNWGGIIAACVVAGLIILAAIVFIIFRCCCRNEEKQIPPDLKTTRSEIQETKLTSPESHPKFNDAVNFLDNVQDRFQHQPDIYRSFLGILTEYRSKKINKADLARKVETLFEGHPDLVTGFKDFLKSRREKVEKVENEYAVVDMQVQENLAATDKEKVDYINGPESHPKFNAASQFVDLVQTRFVDQPEVYTTFLKILNDFKPKKMRKSDLKAEVHVLFADHPDLIEGFNDFISSKGKKSKPENEHLVVDLQGDKAGEVYVNNGVTEGKV